MHSPVDRIQYLFERFIVRGPLFRLLAMAGIIASIATLGGLTVWAAGLFEEPFDAIWWAFLRLTDPGYLGDDEGVLKRVVSTGITVAGYVVFMGALIAVMTQWFHATMRRIEAGTTPVSMENHFVVLGWTNRTAAIVRELAVSEGRVQRFFARRGSSRALRIVVLADHPAEEVREDLRRVLGRLHVQNRLIVRHGSALKGKHLHRVDFLRAAVALLPADPTAAEHPTNVDAVTVKTLMSILHAAQERGETDLPLIVAEITDDRKVSVAESAYRGPLETLATDRIIARLMAQNIRHPGLSSVYGELLGHEFGNELYAREWRGATTTFAAVTGSYANALALGIVRSTETSGEYRTEMRPRLDTVVQTGDRVVLIAGSFGATEPGPDSGAFADIGQDRESHIEEVGTRRILVLGWNRKVPVLLDEFDQYEQERFEVDIVSMTDVDEREREIDRRIGELSHTTVTHHFADFASEDDLDDFALAAYDTIVLVASDWLESDALSDARTLLGHLVVQEALRKVDGAQRPAIVLEVLEPETEALVRTGDDIVVSPMIVSHMLTHVALRRELAEVFGELFGPHGAELYFQPPEHYGVSPGTHTFGELRKLVAQRRDIALGVDSDGDMVMNPDDAQSFEIGPDTRLLALTVY